jgi:hypothetical protein
MKGTQWGKRPALGASRQVVNHLFRWREVADPYLKDTMNNRTGQPGLPDHRQAQGGFSAHSSFLDQKARGLVGIGNTNRRFHASSPWLTFYGRVGKFVRGIGL